MTFPLPTPELERFAEDIIARLEQVTSADFTVAPHRCYDDSTRPGGGRVGVCTSCGLVRRWPLSGRLALLDTEAEAWYLVERQN